MPEDVLGIITTNQLLFPTRRLVVENLSITSVHLKKLTYAYIKLYNISANCRAKKNCLLDSYSE